MITIFHDRVQQNAHSLFQNWRHRNPSGFSLNLKSSRSILLHTSHCPHFGGTQWKSETDSLTEKRKVCARTVAELQFWAKKQSITFRECKDCKPDPDSEDILSARAYTDIVAELLSQAKSVPIMEEFEGIPDRVKATVSRILRDTAIARRVKEMHGHRCQVCGERVNLGGGVYYSEAHHIRPLGKPHNGPDSLSNLLCVCPNHHVELDYRATAIKVLALRTHSGHPIDKAHVAYHNDLVKQQKS